MGSGEWDFFLGDLEENYLNPGGIIALEFNEEPSIGFYTRELRTYFESTVGPYFPRQGDYVARQSTFAIVASDQPRCCDGTCALSDLPAKACTEHQPDVPSSLRSATKAGSLVAGARDVFGVAAAIDVNALGRQFQHPIGQGCQEVPVVRDEQHGALVL